jgi:mono/diheme cytochrome c family protein
MSRRVLNSVLLLLFIGVLLVNVALRPDPQTPNVEFLPEMVRTARYNAYSPHPDLPNRSTLQAPVAGTIARSQLPLHYAASPADALRAAAELTSPVRPDAKTLERGRFVYQNFCQVCHGPGGSGNGPVAMRGFPAPPSLLAERALQMKDGQMFHIVTYGQGNMASYAAQLSREDRWRAIAFIRQLQKQAAPTGVAAGGQP